MKFTFDNITDIRVVLVDGRPHVTCYRDADEDILLIPHAMESIQYHKTPQYVEVVVYTEKHSYLFMFARANWMKAYQFFTDLNSIAYPAREVKSSFDE